MISLRKTAPVTLRGAGVERFRDGLPNFEHFIAKHSDEIIQGHDPKHLIGAVNDWHPPDMTRMHQAGKVMQVLIHRDAYRLGGHNFIYFGLAN